MRIATLQLLAAVTLFAGCATHRPVITTPIAKYDTTKLEANVEQTRTRITSASSHVIRAQVKADTAEQTASRVESEGTLAHSAESQTLVKNLQDLKLELKDGQDDLTQALTEVSSARAETAAVSTNLNDVHSQLVDTSTKFQTLSKQYDKSIASALKYKQFAKWEAILISVLLVIGGGYLFLKFYLHVPFL